MKVRLLFIVAMAVMMVYCSEKKPDPQYTSTTVDENALKLSDSAKVDIKNDPISLGTTAELSRFLIAEPGTLGNIVKRIAFGGVFDSSYFRIKPGMAGVRLWYCFNPSDTPTFFLAVEQISAFNKSNPEEIRIHHNKYAVPTTFRFDRASFDSTTIADFIVGQTTPKYVAPRTITEVQLLQYVKNFKKLVSIISPDETNPYCKYAVAFFENDAAYKNFMNKKPKKIRYYMGFAHDVDHKPNYLRPILAGVDEHDVVIMKRADPPFIQKSVPPPPM